MKENGSNKTKMGLLSCILMGIGSIIGASIFSTTPIAAKIVGGNPIVLGFILAAVFVFIKTLPEMVMISALPANGASYMHLTRLVHPAAGILHAFNQLVIGPMKVATMALTFSAYFAMLIPSIPEIVVAIAITLIFTVISLYGVRFAAWVQNVSVAVLIVAMGVYVFGGFGACKVPFGQVIATTVELGKLWAAMGIMHGSLIGANVLMYAADEIEEPSKNIPLAFIVSTVFTAVLYAAIAFVTVSVQPNVYAIDNLANVAQEFMGPAMLAFFISGGALLAVVTSINACILMFSRSHFAAGRDGLFPKALMNINKHGVPGVSIWVNSGIAIAAMVSGFNLTDVINITSIPGLFMSPVIFASIFFIRKYYPNAYKTGWMRFPHWLNCLIVVVSTAACFTLGWYVIAQMQAKNWILMVAFYAAAFIYTVIRSAYLKKTTGMNIIESMRTPYEPWNRLEESAKQKLSEMEQAVKA